METQSLGGMRYFITFVDDYSRLVSVYFLKDKLNILNAFKDFHKKAENECNKKIKIIRTDNGLEYCNKDFEYYLSQYGIKHQTSTPYTPQQNGLAERMNRTLVERAKCMLLDAKLPKPFWAEATATAAYIINRSPTTSINKRTPYELWTGKLPDLSNIKIFGSEVMMQVPKEKRKKWDPKSQRMIFVGYCDNTKGYRLAEPKTNRIMKSRDVEFLENVKNNNNIYLPCEISSSTDISPLASSPPAAAAPETETKDPDINESSEEYATDTDNDEDYIPQKSTKDIPESTITLRSRNKLGVTDEGSKPSYFCPVKNPRDPDSVKEALSSDNAENWKNAMDEEFQSLIRNNTWILTDLPPGKKALPCKWIFKTKTDETGAVNRHKARLVIKGYTQRKGVDYNEIYSPVVRYTSVRYLIALAARYNLDIDQMDAITAFLQGDLENEIYMTQPELYEEGTKVCLLQKSIYGLKQASRQWNLKLDGVLQKIGLTRSKIDPCIYYCIKQSTMIFVAVWVDDLIIFTNSNKLKSDIKEKLKKEFYMKDLGEAKQFIGINISRNRKEGKIMLDQRNYITEILDRFSMTESKPMKTPIEVNAKFEKGENEDNENIPYRQAIGCLLYLAQATRPDIGFSVNKLSTYVSNPGRQHWIGVKRVMRYIQGTKDYKLTFMKDDSNEIKGYCDSDWASSPEDRRSCTGYIFLFQNGAIAWNSCKQPTVALSTAEAEYMAMAAAAQEALWLRQLQIEFGLKEDCPLPIYCDNQSAIRLAMNDCYKPRTKHIDIRYHFLRDNVNSKFINFMYSKGSEMVADILTKGTTYEKHLFCINKMGLHSGGGVKL
uniref:Integrase catalytic domain-containing protein n=1 Tax=Heliothis virescens TaxID=7102 RepID=A0A2A4JA71_HELVI